MLSKTHIKSYVKQHYVEFIILFFVLFIVFLNLLLTQKIRPFNSDDVSWQTILLTWRPFSHQKAFMGSKDNFLINAPFIYILDLIFGIKRSTIFIISTLFAFINYICFFIAARYFLSKTNKKVKASSYVPLLWLASFGFGFSELFLNPNWRSAQLGITFLFFVLASKIYFKEINPLKSKKNIILSFLVINFAALLVYSDNYFLYFTLVPIFIIYFGLFIIKRTNKIGLYISALSIVYVILAARILRTIMARVGLFTPGPLLVVPAITSLKTIKQNLSSAYVSLRYILGIVNNQLTVTKWSYSRDVFNTLVLLTVILLVITKIIQSRQAILKWLKSLDIDYSVFIVSLLTIVIVADFISYFLVDKGNSNSYRYLIILVYSSIIMMSLLMSKIGKLKYLLLFILLSATVLNITNLYSLYRTDSQNNSHSANYNNYQLINIIKANKLSIGYANYWNANINTYLSAGKVKFLPVACVRGVSKKDYLLINGHNFNLNASRSFYIVQPSLTSPVSCSTTQVQRQFGKPLKTIYFNAKYIMIYNHNLASEMT